MDYSKVKEIRILPNDKRSFPREEDFEFFIRNTMIKRGGIYYFPSQMMRCKPNALVLFQYDGMVRAAGILLRGAKELSKDEHNISYAGHYLFDVNNLIYLSTPIDADDLRELCPNFSMFSQSKQKLPIDCLDKIAKLLR